MISAQRIHFDQQGFTMNINASRIFISLLATILFAGGVANSASCVPTSTSNCVGAYPLPALKNPINPKLFPYKCKGDGVTDDTVCLQKAINAGDVLLPAGKYIVSINKSSPHSALNMKSAHNFQCASPSTVTIHDATGAFTNGNDFGVFYWPPNTSGGSLSNCTVEGTNVPNPWPGFNGSNQTEFLVRIETGAQNGKIVDNVFQNGWGDGLVHVGYTSATAGFIIDNNEFDNCSIYGIAIISASNTQVNYNRAVDCAFGIEPNDSSELTSNTTFDHNYVKRVNGNGYEHNGGSKMFLGMGLDGTSFALPSFSGTLFANSTADGADTYFTKGNPPPSESNINCINGCTAH
jgi:Right handed beta helix region